MNNTTKSATISPPVEDIATPMPRQYRLPSGRYTTDKEVYCETWTSLGKSFGSIIGGELVSFDPVFVYRVFDHNEPQTFSPLVVARIENYIYTTY
jgi:hypothetical protein